MSDNFEHYPTEIKSGTHCFVKNTEAQFDLMYKYYYQYKCVICDMSAQFKYNGNNGEIMGPYNSFGQNDKFYAMLKLSCDEVIMKDVLE